MYSSCTPLHNSILPKLYIDQIIEAEPNACNSRLQRSLNLTPPPRIKITPHFSSKVFLSWQLARSQRPVLGNLNHLLSDILYSRLNMRIWLPKEDTLRSGRTEKHDNLWTPMKWNILNGSCTIMLMWRSCWSTSHNTSIVYFWKSITRQSMSLLVIT